MKRIAIVTCEAKLDLVPSDILLNQVLREKLGAVVEPVVWNQAGDCSGYDLVLIRLTWDYYKKFAEFVPWLKNLKPMVLNPRDLILWNANKKYLLELESLGVDIVPSRIIEEKSSTEIAAKLSRLPWDNMVLKPALSAASYLTYRGSKAELRACLEKIEAVRAQSEILAQPYLDEIETNGELSLVYFKTKGAMPTYSHAVKKMPKRGDFRVQTDFGGSTVPIDASAEMHKTSEYILSKISSEWLFARIDLVEVGGKYLLGELELIEPELYFIQGIGDARAYAAAVGSWL